MVLRVEASEGEWNDVEASRGDGRGARWLLEVEQVPEDVEIRFVVFVRVCDRFEK